MAQERTRAKKSQENHQGDSTRHPADARRQERPMSGRPCAYQPPHRTGTRWHVPISLERIRGRAAQDGKPLYDGPVVRATANRRVVAGWTCGVLWRGIDLGRNAEHGSTGQTACAAFPPSRSILQRRPRGRSLHRDDGPPTPHVSQRLENSWRPLEARDRSSAFEPGDQCRSG